MAHVVRLDRQLAQLRPAPAAAGAFSWEGLERDSIEGLGKSFLVVRGFAGWIGCGYISVRAGARNPYTIERRRPPGEGSVSTARLSLTPAPPPVCVGQRAVGAGLHLQNVHVLYHVSNLIQAFGLANSCKLINNTNLLNKIILAQVLLFQLFHLKIGLILLPSQCVDRSCCILQTDFQLPRPIGSWL